MNRSCRIFIAALALMAVGPTAFGQPRIVCVESSGRVSYGCNDLVPDEVSARFAAPVRLGLCSQDCGFCHDYTVGQAVTQSFQHLGLPAPQISAHHLVLPQLFVSALQDQWFRVALLDSSGSISPLKC